MRDISFLLEPDAERERVRFYQKIILGKFCWGFQNVRKNGYCIFSAGPKIQIYAHRVSLVLSTNRCPKDLYACHKCNNPGCVRPSHLYWGTQQQNMHDMIEAGRDAGLQMRGERQSRAKLRNNQVIDIYNSLANMEHTIRCLSEQYGVGYAVVLDIRRQKSYAEILSQLPAIPKTKKGRVCRCGSEYASVLASPALNKRWLQHVSDLASKGSCNLSR